MIVLMSLTAVFVFSNWGITTAYINERFHTGVRASGFGLGYSLAVILPPSTPSTRACWAT